MGAAGLAQHHLQALNLELELTRVGFFPQLTPQRLGCMLQREPFMFAQPVLPVVINLLRQLQPARGGVAHFLFNRIEESEKHEASGLGVTVGMKGPRAAPGRARPADTSDRPGGFSF